MSEQKTAVQMVYVRSGDGDFYLEVPRPADPGEYDYVPAEKGLAMQELPNGKFIPVRDLAAQEYLNDNNDHRRYFDGLEKEAKRDPKEIKQQFRRLNLLEKRLQLTAIDQVVALTGPNVEQITDEKYLDLMGAYKMAVIEGRHRDSDFQPFSSYERKLTTKSGAVVRPRYAGEVGMRGPIILVLEAGYGAGSTITVPEKLEASHVDGGRNDERQYDDGRGDVHSLDGAQPDQGTVPGEVGGTHSGESQGVHTDSSGGSGSDDVSGFDPFR